MNSLETLTPDESGSSISSSLSVAQQVESLALHTGADLAHLVRFGDNGTEVRVHAEARDGAAASRTGAIDRSTVPLVAQCLDSGVPSVITDSEPHRKFHAGLISGQPYRSGLCMPVWEDGCLVGALAVYGVQPNQVNESSLPSLSDFARVVGKSLKNDKPERTFWNEYELGNFIAEISRITNTSFSRGDVYAQIAEQLNRVVPFDFLSIAVLESERWHVRLRYVTPENRSMPARGLSIPVVDTVLSDVLQSGSGLLTNVDSEPNERAYSLLGVQQARAIELRTLLVAPLWWGTEIIGSLNLGSKERNAYSRSQMNVVNRVVGVVSGSVVNLGLHERLQRRAEVSETLAEIGRIASSSREPEDVMARAIDHIRRLMPFDRLDLNAVDMSTGTGIRIFYSGREVPTMSSGQRMRIGDVAAKSMMRRQPVIRTVGSVYPEDGPEPFQQHDPAEVGLVTILTAPSIARDEPVGALVLRSTLKNAYGPSEADLAMRIARQLSGLLDNARLRAAIEEGNHERYVCGRLEKATAYAVGTDELLSCACDALSAMMPVSQLDASLNGRRYTHVQKHALHTGAAPLRNFASCTSPLDIERPETAAYMTEKYQPDHAESAKDLRIWRDYAGHPWIGFPIEIEGDTVGSAWVHWAADDAGLFKFDKTLKHAGTLLAKAISAAYLSDQLKNVSTSIAVTDELITSFASGLPLKELLRATESAITSRAPMQRIAIYCLGIERGNEGIAIYHRGFDGTDDDRHSDIVHELRKLASADKQLQQPLIHTHGNGHLRSTLNGSRPLEYLACVPADSNSKGNGTGLYLQLDAQTANAPDRRWLDLNAGIWLPIILSAAGKRHQVTYSDARKLSGEEVGIRWKSTAETQALLSSQEITTLLKVAEGFSNVEIGQQLHLSPGTVKNRLGNIYKRLGVNSRTGAVAAAIKAGLIET